MTAKNKTTLWVRLGDYIEECDERNTALAVTLSQGISNTKVFQEPKQVSANSKSDKIVRKGFLPIIVRQHAMEIRYLLHIAWGKIAQFHLHIVFLR